MKYLLLKIWRTNNPFFSREHFLIKEYVRAFKYTNYYTKVLEIRKIVMSNSLFIIVDFTKNIRHRRISNALENLNILYSVSL